MDCRSSPLRPCWPSPHRRTCRHDRGCWPSPGLPASATTRSRPVSRPSGSWEPEGGFVVDATEDAATFTAENLARYRAVVFLNTSGEVLDERQKAAFQGFIRGGGGLAAVHQGITTLEKWPWYVALVGGVKFAGHPEVQEATCKREVRDHPATRSLPDSWKWADEWYNFDSNPRPRTHVLLTIDESSYHGGTMGKDHPVCWYHESQGGRVWCTALGHTKEGYGRAPLRQHLLGGIRYAAGLATADGKAEKGPAAPGAASTASGRAAFARYVREHAGDPARGRALVLRSQGRRLRPVPSGARTGRRHRAGPLRGRRQVRACPADRVGARTLAPHRRRIPPRGPRHHGRSGPLRAGPRRVGSFTDPGRRRGPADQPGQGRDHGPPGHRDVDDARLADHGAVQPRTSPT